MSTENEVRVDRTHFDPKPPPPKVRLWFCPACGMNLTSSSLGLEPGRQKCTKRWHLAEPEPHNYVLASATAGQKRDSEGGSR